MIRLSRWLWSRRSGRLALLALLIAFALPMAFMPLIEPFVAASGGVMPFDNQFVLTPARMHEQLGMWTPEAFVIYRRFAAIDFVFPPVFGLSVALGWAWLLGRLPGDRGEELAGRGLLVVPLLSPVCDWIENIGNLITIARWPAPSFAAHVAIAGKYCKYAGLALTLLGTLGLLAHLVLARRRSAVAP